MRFTSCSRLAFTSVPRADSPTVPILLLGGPTVPMLLLGGPAVPILTLGAPAVPTLLVGAPTVPVMLFGVGDTAPFGFGGPFGDVLFGVPVGGMLLGAPVGGMLLGTPVGDAPLGVPVGGRLLGVPVGGRLLGAPVGGTLLGGPVGDTLFGAPVGGATLPAGGMPAGVTLVWATCTLSLFVSLAAIVKPFRSVRRQADQEGSKLLVHGHLLGRVRFRMRMARSCFIEIQMERKSLR